MLISIYLLFAINEATLLALFFEGAILSSVPTTTLTGTLMVLMLSSLKERTTAGAIRKPAFIWLILNESCCFDTDFFTPIFVLSRITGWSAHIMEQHAAIKLIRPLSKYSGEKHRKVVLLNQR